MANTLRALMLALALVVALTLGVAVSPAPASAGSPVMYTVGWGDTLYSIAARYGMSVNVLMQANGLRNPNYIYIGQRLLIPGTVSAASAAAMFSYVVQPGDTLYSIAARYGVSVDVIRQVMRLYGYALYTGQVLQIPKSPVTPIIPVPPAAVPVPSRVGTYYIVRPGDYLGLIAARFGTTVYAIQIANRLANASLIYTGQRLFIPGATTPYIPPAYNPPAYPPYYAPPAVPIPPTQRWQGVVLSNVSGPCSIAVTVVGKENWPVVLSSLDNGTTTDPKYTGSKPERGPYVVEFAPSCTGTWRVIPLGLNATVDVTLNNTHAEVQFYQTY